MKVQFQTDFDTKHNFKKEYIGYINHQDQGLYQNYQSSKIEIPNHIRSKSYEHDYFTNLKNALINNQDLTLEKKTRRQHSISQKENDPGFISPKFRYESCDGQITKKSQNSFINELQDCVNLSRVTELTMQSQESSFKKHKELLVKLDEKDGLIDELQNQLTSNIKNMIDQINQIQIEKNQVIQQLSKQIEIYEQQIQHMKQQLQFKQNENSILLKKQKELMKNKDILYNSIQQNFQSKKECNCTLLEKENKILVGKVEQFKQQLNELKSNFEFNNLSLNNQYSIIEKPNDMTQLEKTFKQLADELNLTVESKTVNSSFSILNQEVIEGVKNLKQHFKENEKFVRCLKDLVLKCAPEDYFHQEPNLKEIWKFIKQIMQSYLEMKKQAQLSEELLITLCKYTRTNRTELTHKVACLVVDQEVYLRITEKLKKIFNFAALTNIREIDRKLDQLLK